MRVPAKIQSSGQFWLPQEPDKKVAGTLLIEDGGQIAVEIVGLLEGWQEAMTSSATDEIPRIVGEVEKHGYVTLDGCFFENKNISFGSLARSRLHVSFAFLTVAYGYEEPVNFTKFQFGIEGLDEWHSLTGIKIHHELQKKSATINFEPPEDFDLWTGGDVRLRISFSWTLPGVPSLTNAAISQSSHLIAEYDSPTTLREFSKLAHRLIHFFTLAIGKVVCLKELTASSPTFIEAVEPGGRTRPIRVPIYFESLSFCEVPSKISRFEMLFTYPDIAANRQSVFVRWFAVHEKVGAGMNLYFSATGDPQKYLNVRFLWLAQALETYHRRTTDEKVLPEPEFELLRWNVVEATPAPFRDFIQGKLAYANEVSLRTRIKQMVARFEAHFAPPDVKKFVGLLVDTRNYFTHFDPASESKAAHGSDLWRLTLKMEALFQLLMMQDLGFGEPLIATIVGRNRRVAQALKARFSASGS